MLTVLLAGVLPLIGCDFKKMTSASCDVYVVLSVCNVVLLVAISTIEAAQTTIAANCLLRRLNIPK